MDELLGIESCRSISGHPDVARGDLDHTPAMGTRANPVVAYDGDPALMRRRPTKQLVTALAEIPRKARVYQEPRR